MADQLIVTVVVPAYNCAPWIGAAVESVLAQTLPAWECVVVDDGSSDDTAVAAESFDDPRVRLIRHDVNRGVAAALNSGVRAARGRYVQILAADDLLESEKLERQSTYLDAHPDVGMVYGEIRYFDDGRPTLLRRGPSDDRDLMLHTSGGRDVMLPLILRTNGLPVQAALVRSSVFDIVGLHDESLRSHEDYDWSLRCALADVYFAYMDAPNTRVLARRRRGNLTRALPTMLSTKVAVHEKMAARLEGPLAAENRKIHSATLWVTARDLARQGSRGAAARLLLRAARVAPSPAEGARLMARAPAALVGLWPRSR